MAKNHDVRATIHGAVRWMIGSLRKMAAMQERIWMLTTDVFVNSLRAKLFEKRKKVVKKATGSTELVDPEFSSIWDWWTMCGGPQVGL